MATIQKGKRALLGAYILGIIILQATFLSAQLSFLPKDDEYINSANSGVSLAVGDINGDGLDDIARFHNAQQLQLLLQLPSGKYKLHFEGTPTLSRQWNILLYDLNKDGWAEVISSGSNEIYYWVSDARGQYERLRDQRYFMLSQAANLTDINKDGIPDLFICNDAGENLSLKGDRQFPWDRMDYINFTFPSPEDYAGNYGSVWQDINGDGRADLYISKCFQTATSPEDPRRINQLFLSVGDTMFSESAVDWGVADSAQSWASTFADVDNDGDWDLFVLNHDAPSALYINQGDHFVKSTDFADPPIESTSVQIIAQDFNCDGWIDFLVTGRETELLINLTDGTFVRQNSALFDFNDDISTASSGDLNNDGYPDLIIARHDLYNDPSEKPDRLLLNQGGTNHYFKFELIDENGNIDGLGALCKVYSGGMCQMRSLRVGDSYGISNSNILHFGLGSNQNIDSLTVEWADGQLNAFYDVEPDKTYYLKKGGELQSFQAFEFEQEYLCENDTVQLSIPDPYSDAVIYHYETNSVDSSSGKRVTEEGNYYWEAKWNGELVRGKPIYIPFEPLPPLTLDWDRDAQRCHMQTAILSVDSSSFVAWNDGNNDFERSVDSTGEYFAILEGKCAQYYSDTVSIAFYPSVEVKAVGDTVNFYSNAILTAEGENIAWYRSEYSDKAIHFGNQLLLSRIERDTTVWVSAFEVYDIPEVRSLGEPFHSGPSKYHEPFTDGALNFRVFQDCELISVEVQTEIPGKRGIQLIRGNSLVRVDTFSVDSGVSELNLNWPLKGGEKYTIKTDRGISFAEFQTFSPKLFRTKSTSQLDLVEFPYSDDSYIEITGSNLSQEEYFYFYNWKTKGAKDTCYSERIPVAVIVRDTTIAENATKVNLQMFPNPASHTFRLNTGLTFQKGQLQLFSSTGQVVRRWKEVGEGQEFSLEGLADGWYIVRFYYDGKLRVGRLLKVDER